MPKDHQIVTLTYKPNDESGLTVFDRRAIYDLYCEGVGGSKFIVEMQKAKQTYFKDRALFYTTFPVQAQAKKSIKQEEERIEWDFKLAPIYVVSVLDFVFDEDKAIPEGTVVYFVELKDQYNRPFYDKLLYIYLAMPRFNKTLIELITPQDNWLYILKNLPNLEEVPKLFQKGILSKVFKVADMANLSREERRAYEESVKQYRDLKNVTDTAFHDGEMLGEQKGIIKGKREANEATILKGHKKGLPIELLATLTDPELSVQEVLEIIQKSKNQKE